ncbi:MAG: hypothetical protein LBB65_02570 [Burkholderiales bacterium]|jgi:hypothetical protein|nr:hypothetical protein [Burkholderiales bacterium]
MKTILILLFLLLLSACATTPRPSCVDTIPRAAMHGCEVSHLAAPLPDDARASDLVADDLEIIEALAACRASFESLVNHIKIACPNE